MKYWVTSTDVDDVTEEGTLEVVLFLLLVRAQQST